MPWGEAQVGPVEDKRTIKQRSAEAEALGAGRLDGHAVGEDVDGGQLHAVAARQADGHAVGARRLHPDHQHLLYAPQLRYISHIALAAQR